MKNTKVKVHSPDGDTDFFDIVAGVLQGDTLAPYLFIICWDNVLSTSIDLIKENDVTLKRQGAVDIGRHYYGWRLCGWHSASANTPTQAESQLSAPGSAAGGIGLHVNTNNREYVCFNQEGDISTLNNSSLKLVDKFTYHGSSVSSIESNINMRLAKVWTAIDRLSIIWKSDLSDKIKRNFFQVEVVSILLFGCTTWMLIKRIEKKLDGNWTWILQAILNKSWKQHPTKQKLHIHLLLILKTIQVRRTRQAGHCSRGKGKLM